MASYPARKGSYTFADFIAVIPDGEKADLLDGAIYVASPDNTDAADLLSWLAVVLGAFVSAKRLGKIYLSRIAYRLDEKHGPEPDLGFVPTSLEHKRHRGFIEGPPMLAIEIVSPDSVARDYVQKRAVYETAGVREYWILDPDERRATFLVLKRGRYKEASPKNHIFTSEVLPGFSIDVRWLTDRKRPAAYKVIRRFLGDE
jgi:Uma2 family endonuclease